LTYNSLHTNQPPNRPSDQPTGVWCYGVVGFDVMWCGVVWWGIMKIEMRRWIWTHNRRTSQKV